MTLARFRQPCQLIKGERLALTPSAPTGRLANRRRHVVLHPSIGHRERQNGSQRGQGRVAVDGARPRATSEPTQLDTSAAVIEATGQLPKRGAM